MIEVVGILVSTRYGQHAGTQRFPELFRVLGANCTAPTGKGLRKRIKNFERTPLYSPASQGRDR